MINCFIFAEYKKRNGQVNIKLANYLQKTFKIYAQSPVKITKYVLIYLVKVNKCVILLINKTYNILCSV